VLVAPVIRLSLSLTHSALSCGSTQATLGLAAYQNSNYFESIFAMVALSIRMIVMKMFWIYILIIMIIAVMCLSGVFQMMLADELYYTPKNWLYYQFCTPEIIKNAPHVSSHIRIQYASARGSQLQIHRVYFRDPIDKSLLEQYLHGLGYAYQYTMLYGDKWIAHHPPRHEIYLNLSADDQVSLMTVITSQ
jgi:hypothetical protein